MKLYRKIGEIYSQILPKPAVVGFIILGKISYPFNRMKWGILALNLFCLAFSGLFLGKLFAVSAMSEICILLMVVFGFVGFLFKKLHISPAPMALGIILGSLVELNYRRGLMAGKYNVALFVTRPVAAVLALLLVFFVVWPIVRERIQAKENRI